MAELRWTPEQVRAIESADDTLLVANAGTGKTTTVVGKILWRLGMPFGIAEETGVELPPPEDRLAMASSGVESKAGCSRRCHAAPGDSDATQQPARKRTKCPSKDHPWRHPYNTKQTRKAAP